MGRKRTGLSREEDTRKIALGLQGSLTGKDVDELRRATRPLRESERVEGLRIAGPEGL